ncbi:MAG TPA: folate-binding protein [Chakrabartia sp.]|jgi:folate-binding protein YgfZ|nr:folate-binding protein [Chakrabartia sp.]
MTTTLPDRAIIRLSGEDVRGFLQGLITNDVLHDLPVWAGLLTPQGKALFDFLVWADGDDLLIDCEAARAEALVKRLSIYRLRRPIRIATDAGLAVHWSKEAGQGVPDPRDARLGGRWIAPASNPAEGWLAHRLALGVVEGVAELGDGTTLWLECNAREQNGVSFTKGCYVGQENTARMHHREKVGRGLRVVSLAEAGEDARVSYPELGLAVVHRRLG